MTDENYLLDTNVISEETAPLPDARALGWLKTVDRKRLYVSVLALGEVRLGIEACPEGRKKRALQAWLGKWEEWPSDHILPVTLEVVRQWGRIAARDERLQSVDGLMAATALTRGMVMATRNIKHFRDIPGLKIFNPWAE